MRRALIPAFLLLFGSTILGATVVREPLAQAASPISSVFVTNDASSPVPVREQNVDENGNLEVHEQGTADVRVVESGLLTTAPQGARETFYGIPVAAPGSEHSLTFPNGPINASLISLTSLQGNGYLALRTGAGFPLLFETDEESVVLPLTQPLTIDGYRLVCAARSPVWCRALLNVVGR